MKMEIQKNAEPIVNIYNGDIKVDHSMSPDAIKESNKIRKVIVKDMLDQAVIQDNLLNGIVVAISHTPAIDKHVEILVRFKLNNRDFTVRKVLSNIDYNMYYTTKEQLTKLLYDTILKYVSVEIYKELDKALF